MVLASNTFTIFRTCVSHFVADAVIFLAFGLVAIASFVILSGSGGMDVVFLWEVEFELFFNGLEFG
jgi:hypothetical protein